MKNSALKRSLCVLVSACTAVVSSSCGSPETIHSPIEQPDRLTVSWWGNENRSDYMIAGIKEYEKQNPDIVIRPFSSEFTGYKENLDALMSCGKEPDIVMINSSWLPEYSPEGDGFCDLYQFTDKIALSNFSGKELSYGSVNGKLNALPVSLNDLSFYYNKDLLNRYGLTAPDTWFDLFSNARVLSEHGIYTLEGSDKYYWILLTAREEQISGREAFGDNCFTEENVISMMDFFKRLRDEEVIPPYEFERSDFLKGRTSGIMVWISEAQYYAGAFENSGGKVEVGDYPRAEMNKRFGWYVKPTCLYAISRNCAHPEEAAEFLNYLMNDSYMSEQAGIENGVPLSRSAQEILEAKGMLNGLPYQSSERLRRSAEMFSLMPPQLEEDSRINAFFEYFDLYYYGKMTASAAAAAFLAKYPYKDS